jgi:hypothetical protein
MSDRSGFLFQFVMLFLLGLFAVINPKAAKKENADVPGSTRPDSRGCQYGVSDWWEPLRPDYPDFFCICS